MKTVWFAAIAVMATTSAMAQSTIYKHVDESGRITYSNKPMKGAVVVDLDPLTTISGTPAGNNTAAAPMALPPSPKVSPAKLVVTDKPLASSMPRPSLAAVQPVAVKPREDPRRRELVDEIARTEKALAATR